MAKNRQAAQLFTSLFRLRKVHKTYLAICHGELEKNSGEWNDELIRYENGKKKKPSLMSLILNSLKKREIIFDNNYFLYKDFLPIDLFCLYIEKLIILDIVGTINIGSGIPTLVKNFVARIIDVNKIKIRVKLSNKFLDQSYSYNIEKLNKLTGIKITEKKLNVYFSKLKNKN